MINKCFSEEVRDLFLYGHRARGTLELLHQSVLLPNASKKLCAYPGSRLHVPFLITDLIDILSGFFRNSPSDANPGIAWLTHPWNIKFIHNVQGASKYLGCYGELLFDQIQWISKEIVENPESRQLVATIWQPSHQVVGDPPCTMLLHFILNRDKLDCSVHMRSQDILRGHLYDIWHFATLQEIYANIIDVEVGKYIHYMDSLHAYERSPGDDFGDVTHLAKIFGFYINQLKEFDIYDYFNTSELIWDESEFAFLAELITKMVLNKEPSDVEVDYEFEGQFWEWYCAMLAWYYKRRNMFDEALVNMTHMRSELVFPVAKMLARSALKRGKIREYKEILECFPVTSLRPHLEGFALYGDGYVDKI